MPNITIDLPEERLQRLRELASEANIAPEVLLRISVEEWLSRPKEDFARAAGYVLRKNAKLYRRLAGQLPTEEELPSLEELEATVPIEQLLYGTHANLEEGEEECRVEVEESVVPTDTPSAPASSLPEREKNQADGSSH